ncbi:hypothetical protein [Actinomadura miaoliensis]|uniref:ATP-binding protein n=1 Tax=Actinomadura miaoliensis TaxID=430685 RepID=A0ABP7X0E8_9ACTN
MAVDLTTLAHLPGAADQNFEALARAIVIRRYGALGTLRERRQQPGVEFYLRVEHPGELGDPGRVWGWSCKWFILGPKHELTSGQRKQIEESVDRAVKYVDGLTDFVLGLPERPAKKDEEWIDGLGPAKGISTKLWAAEDFDAQMAGLDDLRSTFFGELVLSPGSLAQVHERCVAPIRARWLALLHTTTHVEHRIERILLRPTSFDWLDERIAAIASRTERLRIALPDIDDDARADAETIADDLERFTADLRAIADASRNRRPMEVRERVADQEPPATSPRSLRTLLLDLRKRRLPAALAVTGLSAEIRDVVGWLQDVRADLQAPLTAIVAAAGMGKTHLAAQLTAPEGQPTAGVFIQGGRLRIGENLDDVVRRIPGLKVDRFEDLLLALDSAGARAGTRIPLVIDGLNEAERPSQWRALLDELTPALGSYPNVLVIVTLREALAERTVPGTAVRLDLAWRRPEVEKIVATYFADYLIDARGAWLPAKMFGNPLFVRMYCEAANPDRKKRVGAEALPTSLVGVFERYRDSVADRLAADPARTPVPPAQIKRRLAALARRMWDLKARRLPSEDARAILDEGETNWDESLLRRLVDEGILFRDEVDGSDDTEVGFLFDRLAGYLIADALLVRMPYAEVDERLAEPSLWNLLGGKDGHPFGEDIVIGLIGLLPRRFGGHHLWRLSPDKHRPWVLAQELDSESVFLDDETVDALAAWIVSSDWKTPGPFRQGNQHPFDRLWEVRSAPAHRLNAAFLDRVLRQMPLPERDRRWTEWVRYRGKELASGRKRAIWDWSRNLERTEADDLHALATSWLLTSTNQTVRDLATMALQRYGRPEPKRLFDLATRMLDVDDPYVVERIIGAAFGAASAHQMPDPGGTFERALAGWLIELRDHFLRDGSSPTSHELLRSYVRAIFEFAGTLHPSAVPDDVDPFTLTFVSPPPAPVMADDAPNAEECSSTFGMDFENYIIGPAIEGRANYDSTHPDFRRARGEVMARVWNLGWRTAMFGGIDRDIAEDVYRLGRERVRVERYGKKYGWIAYHELVGRLADAGETPDRWVGGGRNLTPDIDPSFPGEPPAAAVPLPEWAPEGPIDDREWVRAGAVTVPEQLWAPEELYGVLGGWLLVEGFLEHRRDGRKVWGFFRTLLLEPPDVDPALELIIATDYLGNDFLPRLPVVHGVFAGEAPWSPRFQVHFDDDAYMRPVLRRAWSEEGISIGQVAVELSTKDGEAPTSLQHSYDVPSFGFAAEFGLRQRPSTLDLVSIEGTRASATFRAEAPWRGHLLFLRRDLVVGFADQRRIMQVAWGEREATVDWRAVPTWLRELHQSYQHVWRNIRVLDEDGRSP